MENSLIQNAFRLLCRIKFIVSVEHILLVPYCSRSVQAKPQLPQAATKVTQRASCDQPPWRMLVAERRGWLLCWLVHY